MKEKILEAFSELGFKLEEVEGIGYCFKYEELNLVYMYNNDDEEFLSIALPGIVDVEEDKMDQIHDIVEKINFSMKYIKGYILYGCVWLFYERELIGEEDLEKVITHMIIHLETGLAFARKAMAEMEAGNGSEERMDDDDDNE